MERLEGIAVWDGEGAEGYAGLLPHRWCHLYLTEGVSEVVSQKLIPAQIGQLILRIRNDEEKVDVFVGKLASENDFLTLSLARGRDTRQEHVEGSPTQSRISPSIQPILRFTLHTQSVRALAPAAPASSSPPSSPPVLPGTNLTRYPYHSVDQHAHAVSESVGAGSNTNALWV